MATKSVSEFTSTITALFPSTTTFERPSAAILLAPLIEEDLIDIKNKKIFLSGYVDDENGVFYVTKIGHLPATENSSDAK